MTSSTATGLPAPRPRRRVRGLTLLGPALVAGVAYLDPGNVASNISAGAIYGYLLVWVVVVANIMAWLIQYLSAKLGVVTGQSLSEILGYRIQRPWARRAYWLQAELVAMATDVAEIVGGAIALALLFNVPLIAGGVITSVVSLGLLSIQSRRGARPFEFTIIGLLIIITVGFVAGLFISPPSLTETVGGLVPRFTDTGSVLLAASILGATVMPHAIYAHSALTRDRFNTDPSTLSQTIKRLLRITRWDVSIAMVIAGGVNLGMLLLAASTLAGVDGTDTLEGAHAAIEAALGPIIATLFAVALLASGLASTAVGAYAGSEVMAGLLRIRVPILVRRIVTLIPALLLLGMGVDPTQALILSQVALSFGIPFSLVPLIVLTAQRRTLGTFVNRRLTTVLGILAATLLIALNLTLLILLAGGHG